MAFLDDDFLLTTAPARKLYHEYAEKMPLIDYHCHLDPKDIYENKNYPNLTRIWLNDGIFGDHYKWRLERANGVPEKFITGAGDEYQKLIVWAKTIEKAIGNPLYEWTQLELKRFFKIGKPFTVENVPEIWEQTGKMLQSDDFKPRNLIKNAHVKIVCTTDDPISDLHYHQLLAQTQNQDGFKVLPAMRPDNLLRINQGNFGDYLAQLSQISGIEVTDFTSLIAALEQRFEFFDSLGGRLSDHGLNTYHYVKMTTKQVDEIIAKARIDNQQLSTKEIAGYQTLLLESLMKLNKKFAWTMQFHLNVLRNANRRMFKQLGPDTGFDSMGTQSGIAGEMMKLLADADVNLPKTILYSTNPNDWMELATGMQSFQGDEVQRLQLGCAWWFNDTREGMRQQLQIMAQQSLLANFTGMLTDSRSFLSYPRHEYFRRVLCELIGEWVVRGQVVEDYQYLGKIVADISYNNARRYFGFFE
ncbi:glucuronate isomerase [Liquorilactobacillus satsumensis]|uniref:glucuronate isomerase n=1 Tax=Liquorilactobacillus satsumensis TaxID=259059 RepID=UPI0039EA1730